MEVDAAFSQLGVNRPIRPQQDVNLLRAETLESLSEVLLSA